MLRKISIVALVAVTLGAGAATAQSQTLVDVSPCSSGNAAACRAAILAQAQLPPAQRRAAQRALIEAAIRSPMTSSSLTSVIEVGALASEDVLAVRAAAQVAGRPVTDPAFTAAFTNSVGPGEIVSAALIEALNETSPVQRIVRPPVIIPVITPQEPIVPVIEEPNPIQSGSPT